MSLQFDRPTLRRGLHYDRVPLLASGLPVLPIMRKVECDRTENTHFRTLAGLGKVTTS